MSNNILKKLFRKKESNSVNIKTFRNTLPKKYVEDDVVKPEIHEENFYGVIGDVVDVISESTEALDVGVAIEIMGMLSASIEPENISLPYGSNKTVMRLNSILVGKTSHGKGISSKQLKPIYSKMKEINPELICPIFEGAISSPEGIITQMRDVNDDCVNNDLPPSTGHKIFVLDEEISRVFTLSKSASSTLSNTLRTLYDGTPVEPLTKYNRVRCSNPHFVLNGHITPEELVSKVDVLDFFNGFLNRYPMYYAERKVLKPFPKKISDEVIDELACKLLDILEWASEKRELSFSTCYVSLWESEYERLTNIGGDDTVEAALLARARHYATMYAMLFATIDKSDVIYAKHLQVALSWVSFWHGSIRYLFSTKNNECKEKKYYEKLEKIFEVIKREIDANEGRAIGKTPITKAFSGKYNAKEITEAIHELASPQHDKIRVKVLKRNAMEISLC
ncbi:TPA: hypothetical protein NJ627_003527 [Vibrio parahaemolyticus]|nr:hypothetical protein [Vibrio parahaemolyticus]